MRRILLGSAAALAMFAVLPVNVAGATHTTPLGSCKNPFQRYDGPDADGNGDGDIDCYPGETTSRCGAPSYSIEGKLGIGGKTYTVGTGKSGSKSFYVNDRDYATGNGIWVYQESNFADGLTRGGSSAYVPDDPEVCTDPGVPDTLIF